MPPRRHQAPFVDQSLATGNSASAGYAELHCLSNFSFLRGASHPEELVARAAELGYQAIAITDECTVSGLVKAHLASKECGIQLIVGAEFVLEESVRVVLLANSRRAYGQICQLITLARRRAEKGEYLLTIGDLERHPSDYLMLWAPDHRRPGHYGDGPSRQTGNDSGAGNEAIGKRLQQVCPSRLWLALELHLAADDLERTAAVLMLSESLGLPIVASGDVHMHIAARQPLQDVLTATRFGTTVREAGQQLGANRERHMRSMAALAGRYPAALLTETLAVARRCRFSLDELRYEYPEEVVPPGHTPGSYLRELTTYGAGKRWPAGTPCEVERLIDKELDLIEELAYEHYFLTVYDIVQFARSQGILCQGRGSAANSAVCYCLEITEVDPSRMSVLFERFISKERNEPPDIDVDFEHERREEVIQYIYKRYGRDRAALAATLITYRPKSAIRDVGKALGLDASMIDHLAKSMAWWDNRDALIARFEAAGLDPNGPLIGQFLVLVNEILGFPRHLSQHVGGFVISAGPLAELVPVENAAMADRTVIQWDKDDLEALGLLKVDILALGMLTAIRKAFDLINLRRQPGVEPIALSTVPPEDPDTYAMLQAGDSTGVFQVESRAQMAMLPRLLPANFYDLVIEVAIVRPGPIQGDMVHPYLRRRQGIEPVSYPNDDVRAVLERTLGVPIFQEQVIKLAMVAAGFSAGEADRLRRAMAAWRRRGGLELFEQKLINGMLDRGHDRAFAERVFAQIKGFGEYGFPESHAASFALLVYVSAWLKRHHPAAFYCGLLNSQPMGFYTPSQLIQDARRNGVEVREVDVQHSGWDHVLEDPAAVLPDGVEQGPYRQAVRPPAVRLGMRIIKGMREEVADAVAGARRRNASSAEGVRGPGAFASTEDLARRAGVDTFSLRCLARAGALESLSGHRYQAHWDVHALESPSPLWAHRPKAAPAAIKSALESQPPEESPPPPSTALAVAPRISAGELSSDLAQEDELEPSFAPEIQEQTVALAAPSAVDDLVSDYQYLGLTLGQHPLAMLRRRDPFRRCATAGDLQGWRHGRFARVAGVVTGRQRPGTASGVIFMTLEDETGNINVVIWSSVLARFRPQVLHSRLVMVKGVVEREGRVVHLVAGHLTDLGHALGDLAVNSRDFH